MLLTLAAALAVGAPGQVVAQDEAARKGAGKMYGLIGKMTAVEGKRDALIAVLLEGTKEMPGCLSYVVAKDPADATTIWISEVWDSRESHAASLSIPAVREAVTKGGPMIARFELSIETEPVGGHGVMPVADR